MLGINDPEIAQKLKHFASELNAQAAAKQSNLT